MVIKKLTSVNNKWYSAYHKIEIINLQDFRYGS